MNKNIHKMSAEKLQQLQNLKKSNAAGTHKNKAKDALKDNKKAIKKSLDES